MTRSQELLWWFVGDTQPIIDEIAGLLRSAG
jgi:hypothetical protein